MSEYSALLDDLHRKAAQGTGKLQAVVFDFQGGSLAFCKSYENKMLATTVGGTPFEFTAASFEITEPQVSEGEQQVLAISFPSVGTEMYNTIKTLSETRAFFRIEVTYLEYYIDGDTVDPDPGYKLGKLYAVQTNVDAKANVTIQASTDNLNTFQAEGIYTYDDFPTLRGL